MSRVASGKAFKIFSHKFNRVCNPLAEQELQINLFLIFVLQSKLKLEILIPLLIVIILF